MREAECKSVCVHKKISITDGPIWVSLALCSKAKLITGTVSVLFTFGDVFQHFIGKLPFNQVYHLPSIYFNFSTRGCLSVIQCYT